MVHLSGGNNEHGITWQHAEDLTVEECEMLLAAHVLIVIGVFALLMIIGLGVQSGDVASGCDLIVIHEYAETLVYVMGGVYLFCEHGSLIMGLF